MANIFLRGKTWHARLRVPDHLRPVFNKREFTQSLKTSSKAVAQKLAIEKVAMWRLEIAASSGDTSASDLLAYDIRLRDEVESSKGLYADPESQTTHAAAYAEAYVESLPAAQRQSFLEMSKGKRSLPFDHWIIEWADKTYSNHKTNLAAIYELRRFTEHCPLLDDVTKDGVRKFLRSETRSRKSVEKCLSFCRKYYEYLQDMSLAPDELYPFLNVKLPNTLKASTEPREPFALGDLQTLLNGIQSDPAVYQTAVIALFTGARIAEVLALRGSSYVLRDGFQCLYIAGTKTVAADRYVPVHPELDPLLQLLLPTDPEDWLIGNVRSQGGANRRADVIGKRFGRLKTKLGFPATKVFHSLRKTFITACEQAEASEGVVADMVGHEKQTMTYGLYSGGSSIKQRVAVVNSLTFGVTLRP